MLYCKRPSSDDPQPQNTGDTPIIGTVKERGTGNNIANVKLTLSEQQISRDERPNYQQIVDSTTTDDNGNYTFSWKMKDDREYELTYEKEGYYDEPLMRYSGYYTNDENNFDLLMSAPSWVKFTFKNTTKRYEGFRFQDWEWSNVIWDYDLEIDTIIRQVPGDKAVKFNYYKYVKNEYDPSYNRYRIDTICPTRDTLFMEINY